MYAPLQPGIPRWLRQDVQYAEHYPAAESPAYCFWSLATGKLLAEDFEYLVIPDACVDIIFDISAKPAFTGALIMTPHTTATQINLGRTFSFVGIRLRPGAWRASPQDIVGKTTPVDKLGSLDLRRARTRLQNALPAERPGMLQELVGTLAKDNVIGTSTLLGAVDGVTSIKEYTHTSKVSRRHLQRLFRRHLGFSPHDFIKITRFQQALRQRSIQAYADQSHYIHECKRITRLTPGEFQARYR